MDTDLNFKDKVKDGGNKKKVAIYYRKEFVYTRQVSKKYNIICYQVGYPLGT